MCFMANLFVEVKLQLPAQLVHRIAAELSWFMVLGTVDVSAYAPFVHELRNDAGDVQRAMFVPLLKLHYWC
jgi:hypothetical protein